MKVKIIFSFQISTNDKQCIKYFTKMNIELTLWHSVLSQLATLASPNRVLVRVLAAPLLIKLPANAPGKPVIMTLIMIQNGRASDPMWGGWMEFLAPCFGLTQP